MKSPQLGRSMLRGAAQLVLTGELVGVICTLAREASSSLVFPRPGVMEVET